LIGKATQSNHRFIQSILRAGVAGLSIRIEYSVVIGNGPGPLKKINCSEMITIIIWRGRLQTLYCRELGNESFAYSVIQSSIRTTVVSAQPIG